MAARKTGAPQRLGGGGVGWADQEPLRQGPLAGKGLIFSAAPAAASPRGRSLSARPGEPRALAGRRMLPFPGKHRRHMSGVWARPGWTTESRDPRPLGPLPASEGVLPRWDARVSLAGLRVSGSAAAPCSREALGRRPALPPAPGAGDPDEALRGKGTSCGSLPRTFSNEVNLSLLLARRSGGCARILCGPEAFYFLKWNSFLNSPGLAQLCRDTPSSQ